MAFIPKTHGPMMGVVAPLRETLSNLRKVSQLKAGFSILQKLLLFFS